MKKSVLFFIITVALGILLGRLSSMNDMSYYIKNGTHSPVDPHSPSRIITIFLVLFIFIPLYSLVIHYAKKENIKAIKFAATILLVIYSLWAFIATLQALV